jgi:ADP-heptose:LPS heptosyltransferase
LPPQQVVVAENLDTPRLAALVELAPLVLTNNTGPAHLAAAVGTPVVDLYALTNPQHTPWQVPQRVLSFDVECRHCFKSVCPERHHLCLRNVRPDEVAEAVMELWTETRPHGSRTDKELAACTR